MNAGDGTRPEEPRPVCFLHLPKTGGTSLSEALKARYRSEDTLTDDHSLSLAFIEAHRSRLNDNVLFYGHPVDSVLDIMRTKSRVVTLLRSPQDHTVSHYLWAVTQPTHPEHMSATALGFKPFMRRHSNYTFLQTAALSTALTSNAGTSYAEFERRAWRVRNLLDEMCFVGTLERVEESYALLSRTMNLETPLKPPRHNMAVDRGVSSGTVDDLRGQYDELRDDPALSYFIAIEEETYRRAAAVLDRRLREIG